MECFGCDKQGEADQFYPTKIFDIDDEEKYELVSYCEDCRLLFEPHQILFQVVDGPTYTEEDRPSFWRSTEQLYYQHFHIAYGQLQLLDPIMGSTVASQKIMRLGVIRIKAELMPSLKGSPLSRIASA